MKHIIAMALCLAGTLAAAEEVTPVTPAQRHFIEEPLDLTAKPGPDTSVLALEVGEAKKLLKSTDGAHWTVYGTQGPACEPRKPAYHGKDKKLKQQARLELKAAQKQCAAVRKQCELAKKFAEKYDVSSACSTLYANTRVLLTSGKKPKLAKELLVKPDAANTHEELAPK